MEYKVFKIPRPDVVLYLDLPMKIILKLIKERNKSSNRNYVGKKKDIVEGDLDYLSNSRESANWLVKTEKYYRKIDCALKDSIRTREDIHEEIYKKVKNLLKK